MLMEFQENERKAEERHLKLAISSDDSYDQDAYATYLEKNIQQKLHALLGLQKAVIEFKKHLQTEQQQSKA